MKVGTLTAEIKMKAEALQEVLCWVESATSITKKEGEQLIEIITRNIVHVSTKND